MHKLRSLSFLSNLICQLEVSHPDANENYYILNSGKEHIHRPLNKRGKKEKKLGLAVRR